MDKPSQFYSGASSQQMFDPYSNFNEIDQNASSSYAYDKPQSQYQGYHPMRSDNNWNSENVECKQEADPVSYMQTESSNYVSESEFTEPYQYPYNHVAPVFPSEASTSKNVQQHQSGSYHLSSQKSPLPSWYNPPQPPRPFFPQPPNTFHQYPYQTSFAGTPTTPNAEQNMRNMIHLTSRYLSISVADEFRLNDKSSQIGKMSRRA
jgi:hypothetical protein